MVIIIVKKKTYRTHLYGCGCVRYMRYKVEIGRRNEITSELYVMYIFEFI